MAKSPRQTRDQRASAAAVADQVEEPGKRKYAIDFAAMAAAGRSVGYMVSTRLCGRCPACTKQGAEPQQGRTAKDLMHQIASSCSQEPAYLLPGTPITEAVFRLMLASGNRPVTVAEVQGGLTQAWASVIYLKNLNEEVITRMLEGVNEYFLGPVDEE